jgi:membrane-bound metal-dependent hydrolase YbcI (DUF457 family)
VLAAGHLALGYAVGAATAKIRKRSINLPLLFFITVLPDIDYLLPDIGRRSVTHSIVVQLVIVVPFLIKYRYRAVPYFAALVSHSVIDLFNVAGVQLFWPISTYNHPIIPYQIIIQAAQHMELVEVLLTAFVIMLLIVTGVMQQMGKSSFQILLLLGSLGSLGASFIAVRVFYLSRSLIVAQLGFSILFLWPIFQYIKQAVTR